MSIAFVSLAERAHLFSSAITYLYAMRVCEYRSFFAVIVVQFFSLLRYFASEPSILLIPLPQRRTLAALERNCIELSFRSFAQCGTICVRDRSDE